MNLPMLGDEECIRVMPEYRKRYGTPPGSIPYEVRFHSVLDARKRTTGFSETDPATVMQPQISRCDPPRMYCGRPHSTKGSLRED